MKDIVHKIEMIAQEKGFIYTLSFLLLQNFFLDPEEATEVDWRSKLSFQEISFLVGLMVKHPIDFEVADENSIQSQAEKVHQLFKELHASYMEPFRNHIQKIAQQGEIRDGDSDISENILNSGTAMAEAIFYSDSGAYDFQLRDFAVKRYRNDTEWIACNKGFKIETAVNLHRQLKEMMQNKCAQLTKPKDFKEHVRNILSIFCFKADAIVGMPMDEVLNIIRAFSLTPGAVNEKLVFPGEYNAVNSNPIIALDDGLYFIPVLFNLAVSIYESPFYWMMQDSAYKEVSFKNRGQSTVDIANELLVDVFGETNVHKQVIVEKNKGVTLTDIDLLATAGNKAVILQSKSKKLTIKARSGDEEQLKADFSEAIQEAYDQGKISRGAILEDRGLLKSADGNEVNLEDTINDVYILCITSDHYPAVMYQSGTFLKKDDLDPAPLTISIFDLELLTHYLKDPFEFLYYLRQRVALHKHFMGQAEVDLLAYHLNQKLFRFKDDKSEKFFDLALIDGMGQLIDGHFPSARGDVPKTKAMDKLHTKWSNPEFKEIIEQLKRSGQPGFTEAIFLLYDLAGNGADKFIEEVKNLKSKCQREKKSLRFCAMLSQQKCGISYICDHADGGKLPAHVAGYCQVKKYQTKSNMWLGIGGLANSPRLFEMAMFNNEPWVPNEQFEILSKHLYTKPTSMSGRGKIGRNEICFCGSGKKYKKCHGL